MNKIIRQKLFLLLLFAFLVTLLVQIPAFVNPFRVDDDLRQLYWMERFRNPTAYPNDYQIENSRGVKEVDFLGWTFIVQYESWLFSLLYQAGSLFLDPIIFNKVLPLVLMLVSVYYLFRLGEALRDEQTGLLFGLGFLFFSLGSPANISLVPGLQRSFSFPLLIIFLYYFVRRGRLALIISWAVQTAIYFPIFAVSAAAYALSLLRRQGRWWAIRLEGKKLVTLASGVLLALIVFLPAVLSSLNATAPYSTDVPVWENSYYSANGRIPIFALPPSYGLPLILFIGYGGLVLFGALVHLVPLLLFLLVLLAVCGVRQITVPRPLTLLLSGALGVWVLSWLAAVVGSDFILRYPFKYTSAVIPLVLLLLFLYNAPALAEQLTRLWALKSGRVGVLVVGGGILLSSLPLLTLFFESQRMVVLAGGSILYVLGINQIMLVRMRKGALLPAVDSLPVLKRQRALAALFLLLTLCYLPAMSTNRPVAAREELELYNYLTTLPEEAVFAGDPERMANVPLFSKRSVLFSNEIIEVGDEKIFDFYNAYYANSADIVVDFCRQYGVDYLVVNEGQFDVDYLAEERFFYEPYNSYVIDLLAERTDFVLMQVPDGEKLYAAERLFVIPCDERPFTARN